MEYADLDRTKDILEVIVKSLSSSVDAEIDVNQSQPNSLEFTIRIPKEEAGRVIGRYGDVIKSLRSVMYGITMHQHKMRSNVVVEPY